jgi:hypothetical protein
MTILSELQYPIGRFQWSGANTSTDRERMIAVIESIPGRYLDAVAGLTDAQLNTPYRDGGWSLRQVIHHVPDSHMQAYSRTKLALTEDLPVIKTYAEDRWAELGDSRETAIEISLTLLNSLHRRWAVLLRSLTATDWERGYRHPEMGVVTLDKLLALYRWHSEHHLAHITKTRQKHGW